MQEERQALIPLGRPDLLQDARTSPPGIAVELKATLGKQEERLDFQEFRQRRCSADHPVCIELQHDVTAADHLPRA